MMVRLPNGVVGLMTSPICIRFESGSMLGVKVEIRYIQIDDTWQRIQSFEDWFSPEYVALLKKIEREGDRLYIPLPERESDYSVLAITSLQEICETDYQGIENYTWK